MDDYGKAAYWLDAADYDLQTAKAMLETKRYLYVGFMCHQTIEAVVVDDVPDDYLNVMALLWKLGRTVSHDIEPYFFLTMI